MKKLIPFLTLIFPIVFSCPAVAQVSELKKFTGKNYTTKIIIGGCYAKKN